MNLKSLLLTLSLWLFSFSLSAQTRPPIKAVAVPAVAFHPKRNELAVGSWKSVTLFDTKSGEKLQELSGLSGMVTGIAYSPDGALLAASGGSAGKSGEICLWAVGSRNSKPVRVLLGHTDTITALVFAPDSSKIAAASYDHLVSLWSVKGSSKPQYLKDHIDAVYGIAFSPDGKRIASAAGDRTVKFWDATTGKRLFTLSESTAELYTIAFRPDGKQIAAGGVDKALRIWNITAHGGTLAKSAFAHEAAILKIVYAHDGKTLVTSGEDKAVKRWDAVTLAEKTVYPIQSDWAQGLALSPDNRMLAVGRYDGSVTLYDVGGDKVLRELRPAAKLAQQTGNTPKVSTIAGAKLGGRTRPQPKAGNGGVTLFAASLGNIAPVGMKRGQTLPLTLSGGLISDAKGVFFDDPAITGKIVTPPDKNTGILRVETTLAPSVRIGIHRLVVQTPHGTTNSLTFAVGGWKETAQVESNDSPANAQPIAFPATLVGAMDKPGDTDCYAFEAQSGESLVFEVVAQSVRSRLQAVLTLRDAEGRVLKEASPRPGRPDPILGYRFTANGRYIVQIRDFQNASGGDVHYRLNAGHFPFVERVYPLGVQKGTDATVSVTGFNLPHRVTVKAPQTAVPNMTMAVPIPQGDTSGLSEPLGTRLAIGDDPEFNSLSNPTPQSKPTPISVPVSINDALWQFNALAQSLAHSYRFEAKKGRRLIIETQARRLGSPVDTEIEVTNLQGKPIERAVLRAVAQTEMTLNDRDSRTPALRLVAWDSFHIDDYLLVGREVIQILALPKGPDDDVLFRNSRGLRQTYFATTPEFHSVAAPVYKVEVHPPGSRFSPNGYPLTRLISRNDDGGGIYGKDSYLEFDPPADGAYLVKVQDARQQSQSDFDYRLLIHPPRPDFSVRFSPANPNVPQGGGVLIGVECERYDGFNGEIALTVENLPKGFHASETVIEPTEEEAIILLTADSDAVTPPADTPPFRMIAKAKIGKSEIVHPVESSLTMRLLTVLPNPDLTVETDKREVVLNPGGTVYVEAMIDRKNNFGGRVPLDIRNLPHGVRVTDIGLNGVLITEKESSRRFSLYCEPWVKPQTRPIYVMATPDGGVSTAAQPLTLKIVR